MTEIIITIIALFFLSPLIILGIITTISTWQFILGKKSLIDKLLDNYLNR